MQSHMSQYDFVKAFSNLSQILYLGNQYLSESKFWAITDESQLDTILYTSFEVIRLSSILLQPYSPDLTSKILDFIGVSKDQRSFKYAQISEETMQRNIVFDVEKKKEIFVNKYEEEPQTPKSS